MSYDANHGGGWMRILARVTALAAPMALLLVCGFAGDQAQNPGSRMDADFIVTSAPEYLPLAALRGPSHERFPKGAQLLLVHEGNAEPLVEGFAATADADVSFDAKTVLFAGKKSRGDHWQIWELTLEDRSLRRVIATATGAERPFYLPGGRMIWAQRTPHGFELEFSEDGHPPGHSFWNPTAGPGVLHFIPGDRGTRCGATRRVCGCDRRDGIGRLAGERAHRRSCALRTQGLEVWRSCARNGAGVRERGSCRAGSGYAANTAQAAPFRAARLELRQSVGSRCAPIARRGVESHSRVGAVGYGGWLSSLPPAASSSVITLKPATCGHFKTGHFGWPET